MKDSILLVIIFFIFSIIFRYINLANVELACNLVILSTFICVLLLKIDYKKVKLQKDLTLIKCLFIENIIFVFLCMLYAMLMSNVFNIRLFMYFFDLLIYIPLFLLISLILSVFGYKNKLDCYFYGDKKLIILKSIVKIFFIPFIYSSLFVCLNTILMIEKIDISQIDYYFYIFGLTIDVLIALFGYVFTTHWLNNQIHSVDNSVKGWLVCIICYPPFLVFYQFLLAQVDNYTWKDWAKNEWYYYPWLTLVVITWLLYWFSHAHFGFKFSNLTWRGLVDEGLYKYVKHPAYLSKNVYWWLYTVPFFGVYGWDVIHNIIVLIVINLIYYARAKTEEQHLIKFEAYREYHNWIKKNGLWARLRK